MAGEFVTTLGDESGLPGLLNGDFMKGRREHRIAMVGRSNVGKSSLINALLQSNVAQTSKQPGKTRSIHFYFWKEAKKIVADLPGYGFAQAAKAERDRWSKFINGYIKADPVLELAVVLLDSRHGPTDLDIQALEFLLGLGVRILPVFTKSDQLKNQSERALRRKQATEALKKLGYTSEIIFWVSVKSKDGLKPLSQALLSMGDSKNGNA